MKKAVRISVLKARQKRDTSVYKHLCNPFFIRNLLIYNDFVFGDLKSGQVGR